MDASGAAGNGYAAVPVRRKSRKKTVDRKASKGRKIKYVTHPKMQNFMFPQVRFLVQTKEVVVACCVLVSEYLRQRLHVRGAVEAPLCLLYDIIQ